MVLLKSGTCPRLPACNMCFIMNVAVILILEIGMYQPSQRLTRCFIMRQLSIKILLAGMSVAQKILVGCLAVHFLSIRTLVGGILAPLQILRVCLTCGMLIMFKHLHSIKFSAVGYLDLEHTRIVSVKMLGVETVTIGGIEIFKLVRHP